jgi:hypothetical protein
LGSGGFCGHFFLRVQGCSNASCFLAKLKFLGRQVPKFNILHFIYESMVSKITNNSSACAIFAPARSVRINGWLLIHGLSVRTNCCWPPVPALSLM